MLGSIVFKQMHIGTLAIEFNKKSLQPRRTKILSQNVVKVLKVLSLDGKAF